MWYQPSTFCLMTIYFWPILLLLTENEEFQYEKPFLKSTFPILVLLNCPRDVAAESKTIFQTLPVFLQATCQPADRGLKRTWSEKWSRELRKSWWERMRSCSINWPAGVCGLCVCACYPYLSPKTHDNETTEAAGRTPSRVDSLSKSAQWAASSASDGCHSASCVGGRQPRLRLSCPSFQIQQPPQTVSLFIPSHQLPSSAPCLWPLTSFPPPSVARRVWIKSKIDWQSYLTQCCALCYKMMMNK